LKPAPTITYKLYKKAKKHKALFITIASAFIIVCAAIIYGLYTAWVASQQAEITQQLGQKVEKIEAIMDRAFLLPLHDIRGSKPVLM